MRSLEQRSATVLFYALFICAFVLVAKLFESFFAGLVLSMILASLFRPVHHFIERKMTRFSKNIHAALTTILIVVTVICPAVFFVIALVGESEKAYGQLTSWEFQVWLQEITSGFSEKKWSIFSILDSLGIHLEPRELISSSTGMLKNVGLAVSSQLSTVALATISVLINLAMMLMFIHSFFRYGDEIKAYLIDLLPFPVEQEARIVGRFHEITSAVFVGNGFASLMQGILGAFAIAWVFEDPPVLVWATVITILSFIPIAGAAFVFVPVTIWLWVGGQTSMAIGYLVFNMIYVAIFEYVVKTKMIGDRAAMPNMLVLIAIVGGLSAYGILGIFYGPLFMTILLTLIQIYKEHYRNQI